MTYPRRHLNLCINYNKELLNLLFLVKYLIFCNFQLLSYFLSPIKFVNIKTSLRSIEVWLLTHFFANPYNWGVNDIWQASNWNLEKIYRASVRLAFLVHIHCAFEGWPPLSEHWAQLNTTWMLIEFMWMPLSECEHLLNAIEFTWMPLSACEHLLSVIECTNNP